MTERYTLKATRVYRQQEHTKKQCVVIVISGWYGHVTAKYLMESKVPKKDSIKFVS